MDEPTHFEDVPPLAPTPEADGAPPPGSSGDSSDELSRAPLLSAALADAASADNVAERDLGARGLWVGSIPALIMIAISAVILLIMAIYALHSANIKWMFERGTNKTLPPEFDAQLTPKTLPALVMYGLVISGMIAGICSVVVAGIAGCANADVRRWLERQLAWFAIRPLPAFHLIDVIAVIALTLSLQPFATIFLHKLFDFRSRGIIMPVSMLANDIAMACAVGCAIMIAWWRARGWHGALGFWPAWSSAFVSPVRPIWKDILLGVACYPLTFWMVAGVGFLNKFLVHAPDKHPIILELARHPSPLAAAMFLFSATFGAAFFEEIIFRGMLYNSMRRWLGGLPAALGAAFIFGFVHGLKSDLLGLFVMGLVLTWLYDKTGRLVAGMAFHFTNNLMSLLLVLALYNQ